MYEKKVGIGLHQHRTCFMFNVSCFQKRNSPWQTITFQQIHWSKQREIARKFAEAAQKKKKPGPYDCSQEVMGSRCSLWENMKQQAKVIFVEF